MFGFNPPATTRWGIFFEELRNPHFQNLLRKVEYQDFFASEPGPSRHLKHFKELYYFRSTTFEKFYACRTYVSGCRAHKLDLMARWIL